MPQVCSDDGQTDQLRKDHGPTEQDPKNGTTQKRTLRE